MKKYILTTKPLILLSSIIMVLSSCKSKNGNANELDTYEQNNADSIKELPSEADTVTTPARPNNPGPGQTTPESDTLTPR